MIGIEATGLEMTRMAGEVSAPELIRMTYEEVVRYERRGAAVLLTIDQEDRLNALSRDVQAGLLHAVERAELDEEVRTIIVTGRGRAFSAGGDVSSQVVRTVGARSRIRRVMALFEAFEQVSKPVVAAVNGYAIGGGMELVLSCDFAIASERAVLAAPEASLGVTPAFALTRLSQIVGRARAKEVLMTGRRLRAAEAQEWGIVNSVVPHGELMSRAEDLAGTLARQAPLAITLIKSIVNRELGGADVAHSVDGAIVPWGTKDQEEGRHAFLDKRAPVFRGC